MMTKYDIGDKLYALTSYKKSNDEEVPIAVEIVEIVAISIDNDGIDYFVKNLMTGEEWGDSVPEIDISKNIDDLTPKLRIALSNFLIT